VKSFRLYLGNGKEATAPGCLLAVLSAALAAVAGVPLAFALGALTGWVFVAVPVAVGLLGFIAGAAVLSRLGVPLWKDEDGSGGRG
jgi:predicted MFS family arabinose efflux permease